MTRETSAKNRILYIDKLRGLAVLAMFFVHTAGAWLSQQAKQTGYYAAAMKLSGFVAPTFLTLAGVSVVIIARRAGTDDVAQAAARRKVLRRGAEIWLLGYGLSFAYHALGGFHGDWARLGRVDVLHCIGSSLVFLAAFAWPRPDRPGRIVWAALVFAVLPIIGVFATGCGVGVILPTGIREYFVTDAPSGLFPLIPYGAWVAFGVVLGALWHMWAVEDGGGRESLFFAGLLLSALCFWAASYVVAWGYYHLGVVELLDSRQRRGLPHVFGQKAALVLSAFFCAWGIEKLAGKFLPTRSVLTLWGQTSLFSYCAHLIIIYHLPGGALLGKLGPLEQVGAAVLLGASMVLSAALWRRRRALTEALGIRLKKLKKIDTQGDVALR